MIADVFDDKLSIIHSIAGALTNIIPSIVIIFFFYELIEYCTGKDKPNNYIGDILEFCLGYTGGGLCLQTIHLI